MYLSYHRINYKYHRHRVSLQTRGNNFSTIISNSKLSFLKAMLSWSRTNESCLRIEFETNLIEKNCMEVNYQNRKKINHSGGLNCSQHVALGDGLSGIISWEKVPHMEEQISFVLKPGNVKFTKKKKNMTCKNCKEAEKKNHVKN